MAKATNAEVIRRTGEVYTMLVKGASSADIVQHAAEKWGLEERQARQYITKANALLAKQASVKQATEFGKALARLTSLYAASLKLQDYRTCLSVQKEINTLLGLYPPTKTEHTGPDGGAIEQKHSGAVSLDLSSLSTDQLRAIVAGAENAVD